MLVNPIELCFPDFNQAVPRFRSAGIYAFFNRRVCEFHDKLSFPFASDGGGVLAFTHTMLSFPQLMREYDVQQGRAEHRGDPHTVTHPAQAVSPSFTATYFTPLTTHSFSVLFISPFHPRPSVGEGLVVNRKFPVWKADRLPLNHTTLFKSLQRLVYPATD
jgi:hypothetical protein